MKLKEFSSHNKKENLLYGSNSGPEMTEDKISKLGDIAIELTQSEKKKREYRKIILKEQSLETFGTIAKDSLLASLESQKKGRKGVRVKTYYQKQWLKISQIW